MQVPAQTMELGEQAGGCEGVVEVEVEGSDCEETLRDRSQRGRGRAKRHRWRVVREKGIFFLSRLVSLVGLRWLRVPASGRSQG